MPNADGYGWQKIDTFLVLNDLVRRAKGKPCIVTGDFNEPQFEMQDGHVVTWGQKPDGRGGFVVDEADWTDDERTHRYRPGVGRRGPMAIREERAPARILGGSRARRNGCVPRVRGRKCWIDHMFVSTHFKSTRATTSRSPRSRLQRPQRSGGACYFAS